MRKISALPRGKRNGQTRVRRKADRAVFGAGGYGPRRLNSAFEIPQRQAVRVFIKKPMPANLIAFMPLSAK